MMQRESRTPIQRMRVNAYTIPTDLPESDGTLEWDSTTIVIVECDAGGQTGIGYTYAHSASAELIHKTLFHLIQARDAMDIPGAWDAMVSQVRNSGLTGIASTAISAVDNSLWDLKAKLLGLPLVRLLGAAHGSLPAYGSGGFTSYSIPQLQEQFSRWSEQGIQRLKMKVGRNPERDVERVRAARSAIKQSDQLYVDANGAYTRKQALQKAHSFAESGVVWFEEPVSSEDLEGLRLMRDRAPAGIAIAAGEYGYFPQYFKRMLEAGAVDVLQADATRCLGITGFLKVAALCEAWCLPFSAHTAPTLHVHPCCAVTPAYDIEYFHDHVRIEHMFFDGAAHAIEGRLVPDLSRPGIGIEFRRSDAQQFAA
jgi:L-alanine-DL-glutamate epimerase-like enolase superfamily enzyme